MLPVDKYGNAQNLADPHDQPTWQSPSLPHVGSVVGWPIRGAVCPASAVSTTILRRTRKLVDYAFRFMTLGGQEAGYKLRSLLALVSLQASGCSRDQTFYGAQPERRCGRSSPTRSGLAQSYHGSLQPIQFSQSIVHVLTLHASIELFLVRWV